MASIVHSEGLLPPIRVQNYEKAGFPAAFLDIAGRLSPKKWPQCPEKYRFSRPSAREGITKHITTDSHTTYLHLGSNLGDRSANLERALHLISERVGRVTRQSAVYETAAWGNTEQPDFLNQAIEVVTGLPPNELLHALLDIETGMGRVRQAEWAPRVIDLDILFYDDAIVEEEGLHIPHPRLHLRNFVLLPLMDIAPWHWHPSLGKHVARLFYDCVDDLEVVVYD